MRPVDEAAFNQRVEAVYRSESQRALATLIRLLGDFDRAEEALHEAFVAAMDQWRREGLPQNPRAWLVSTARFKAIDRIRRQQRFAAAEPELVRQLNEQSPPDPAEEEPTFADDQLRLIFTCCHPALSAEAQLALTLREVCGLSTEDIARAFLSKAATIAQRIVRAKAKIRDARIPYEIPQKEQLAERLHQVLQVIYLVYNEGYSASSGQELLRIDLATEAIRLGQELHTLLPEPEVGALLALMLLHHARHRARLDAEGQLILLEDQDRSLWDQELIARGVELVESSLRSRRIGPYALQAAIAALHAQATDFASTDWAQIVGLYELLLRMQPSPVIALNRAAAVAMRDGPDAGLVLLDALATEGALQNYHLLHAARADLLRRLDRPGEARAAYLQALALVEQEPEQRFLQSRLEECEAQLSRRTPGD